MNELCLDASAALKLVFKDEDLRAEVRRLFRNCYANRIVLIAPGFFPAEVDSAVLKRLKAGIFTPTQAKRAFGALDKLPVQVRTHRDLRRRAREIARRYNQRAVYDSTYAALAELRGCDFWTADKDFYDQVKMDLSFVKYLADYP